MLVFVFVCIKKEQNNGLKSIELPNQKKKKKTNQNIKNKKDRYGLKECGESVSFLLCPGSWKASLCFDPDGDKCTQVEKPVPETLTAQSAEETGFYSRAVNGRGGQSG